MERLIQVQKYNKFPYPTYPTVLILARLFGANKYAHINNNIMGEYEQFCYA